MGVQMSKLATAPRGQQAAVMALIMAAVGGLLKFQKREDPSENPSAAPSVEPKLVFAMAGCIILAVLNGSIFAFSVFLQPIQDALGLERARASLVYSIGLFFTALGIWQGGAENGKYPTPTWAFTGLLLGGLGQIFAGAVGTPTSLFAGYGVGFGSGVGMCYILSLGIANLWPKRRGLLTGMLLSAFATSPAFMQPMLRRGIATYGPMGMMARLGCGFVSAAPVAYVLFKAANVQIAYPKAGGGSIEGTESEFGRLFVGFLGASLAGLMFSGHAGGIMETFGVQDISAGLTGVALGNWIGRVLSGFLIDSLGARTILQVGALVTAAAGVALPAGVITPQLTAAIFGLGYGSALAGYAAITAELYGKENFGKVYGKLFIAFGMAGLFGPTLGGRLYDKTASYTATLKICAALSFASAVLVTSLPKGQLVATKPKEQLVTKS